jgi:hypothetical protein
MAPEAPSLTLEGPSKPLGSPYHNQPNRPAERKLDTLGIKFQGYCPYKKVKGNDPTS